MGAVHIQNPNSALLNSASREITQNDFIGNFLAQNLNKDLLNSALQKIVQSKPVTEQDFAERLARKRIYHPKELDQEIKDVNVGNFKYQLPTNSVPYRNFKGIPIYGLGPQDIVKTYNKAFKSKTYQDAMKNYELRQQFPDRYVPAGFESLQNLDVYAERGRALQRRGILGRRRTQSLGGEQVPQEAGL